MVVLFSTDLPTHQTPHWETCELLKTMVCTLSQADTADLPTDWTSCTALMWSWRAEYGAEPITCLGACHAHDDGCIREPVTVEINDGPHKRAACQHRARRSMTLRAGCLKEQQYGLVRTCAWVALTRCMQRGQI